ncbi:MAG: aldehyde ferredoxin oxidoreductase N-terminal domain-containing protein [Smithella sp.]
MGKILTVDLSNQTMTEETIPDHVYEQYLSGMGLGAYILYNRIPAGADPPGPENILGFCSGFLTGTGSLFSGWWTLVGKSPLTGCRVMRIAAAPFPRPSNLAAVMPFSLRASAPNLFIRM